MATWPNKKPQHHQPQNHSSANDQVGKLNDRVDALRMENSDLCHRLEQLEYTMEELVKFVKSQCGESVVVCK